MNNKLFLFNT